MVKVKEDLTGRVFGELTVVCQGPDLQYGNQRPRAGWKCSCGREVVRLKDALTKSLHPTCGKCEYKRTINHKPSIVPRMVFGELTAIERVADHITPSGLIRQQWKCKCSCGNEIIVQQQKLKKWEKTHCGCKRPTYTGIQTNKRKNTYDLSSAYGIGYTAKGNRWIATIKHNGKEYSKRFPPDKLDDAIKWRTDMEDKLFDNHSYKNSNN